MRTFLGKVNSQGCCWILHLTLWPIIHHPLLRWEGFFFFLNTISGAGLRGSAVAHGDIYHGGAGSLDSARLSWLHIHASFSRWIWVWSWLSKNTLLRILLKHLSGYRPLNAGSPVISFVFLCKTMSAFCICGKIRFPYKGTLIGDTPKV